MTDSRRRLVLELFRAGLASVDGRACVRRALEAQRVPASSTDPARPLGPDSPADAPVWIAAVGKAAASMALGAHDALGAAVKRVLLITKDGHVPPEAHTLPGLRLCESAHPVPDQRSLDAGQALLDWVQALPGEVQPLFLVSGGASSLVEVPEEGVSLEQLGKFNTLGLSRGLAITELNARRAKLSRIKGGRLAARLAGRPARALFISDVPGDDPAVIGSGLMGPAVDGVDRIERTIVGSADHAVDAVCALAARLGLDAHRGARRFDDDALRLAVRFAHELHLNPAQVCVWGGESTLNLPAQPGRGGRNQHLALAGARLIAGNAQLMLLAAGTDGTDGPTEDAGALVDGESCARITLAGLSAEDCLARADSGTALAASGDLVHTGPTGTNVGDLVIGLKLSAEAASIVCEGLTPPGTRGATTFGS